MCQNTLEEWSGDEDETMNISVQMQKLFTISLHVIRDEKQLFTPGHPKKVQFKKYNKFVIEIKSWNLKKFYT